LSAKPGSRGAVLRDLRQQGSLRALFPRNHGADLQAVLVNTAGGITGGDRFAISARADAGTELTLTTQAAERAYAAQPGEVGTLRNRLFVGPDARLNWLPQETILYQNCAMDRALSVELAENASVLLAEPLVFGRTAMGETLTQVSFRDRIEIRRCGEVLFLDAMDLTGDIAARLARSTIANGAAALVTLIYIAPDAEAHLDPLRMMLPDSAGASLIRDDVLFLRILAEDSYLLRRALIPILNRLTGDALPRPWML